MRVHTGDGLVPERKRGNETTVDADAQAAKPRTEGRSTPDERPAEAASPSEKSGDPGARGREAVPAKNQCGGRSWPTDHSPNFVDERWMRGIAHEALAIQERRRLWWEKASDSPHGSAERAEAESRIESMTGALSGLAVQLAEYVMLLTDASFASALTAGEKDD